MCVTLRRQVQRQVRNVGSQATGQRAQVPVLRSLITVLRSQVTGHKQGEMSFFEIKKMLALVHTVDELELKLFNFVVDS